MKYHPIILYFVAQSFYGNAQNSDTLYYPNGRVYRIQTIDSFNNLTGLFTEFSELDDSTILFQGVYQNGVKVGLWKELNSSFTYEKGLRNGPCNINGATGLCKNGLLEGDFLWEGSMLERYRKGVLVWREDYQDIFKSKDHIDDISKGSILYGKKHGKWITLRPEGSVIARYEYDQGILIGEQTTYHLNGKIESIIPYDQGVVNGTVTFFDRNGKRIADAVYENGVIKDGVFVEYFDTYRKHLLLFDGKESGIETYDLNGKLISFSHEIGPFEIFQPPALKGSFQVSRYVSKHYEDLPEYYTWTFRASEGRLSQVPEFYVQFSSDTIANCIYDHTQLTSSEKDRDRTTMKGYHSNGDLAVTGNISPNQEGEWKTFYPNGKLKTRAYFSNGVPNGLFLNYDSTGKCLDSIPLKNGVRHGRCLSFYPQRNTYVLADYANGLKSGIYREYIHDTIIYGSYVNNEKHGAWKFQELDNNHPHYWSYYTEHYVNGKREGVSKYEKDFPNRLNFYENGVRVRFLEYDVQGELIDSAIAYGGIFNDDDILYRPQRFINEDSPIKKYYRTGETNPFGVDIPSGHFGLEEWQDPKDSLSERYFKLFTRDTIWHRVIAVKTITLDWKGVKGVKDHKDSSEYVYYPDGTLWREQTGRTKRSYYYNGKLQSREDISSWNSNDSITIGLPNGNIVFQGQLSDRYWDAYIGTWSWANESKTFEFQWDFDTRKINQRDENKEREGTWIIWNTENYQLDTILNYRDDQLEGPFISFHQENVNQPAVVGNYSDDKPQGIWNYYNKYGELNRTVEFDQGKVLRNSPHPIPQLSLKGKMSFREHMIINDQYLLLEQSKNNFIDLNKRQIKASVLSPNLYGKTKVIAQNKNLILFRSSSMINQDLGPSRVPDYDLFSLERMDYIQLPLLKEMQQFILKAPKLHPTKNWLYEIVLNSNMDEYTGEMNENGNYIVFDLDNDGRVLIESDTLKEFPLNFTFLDDSVIVEFTDREIIFRDAHNFRMISKHKCFNKRDVRYRLNPWDLVYKISNEIEVKRYIARIKSPNGTVKFFDLKNKRFISFPKKLKDVNFYVKNGADEIFFVDSQFVYNYNLQGNKIKTGINKLRDFDGLTLTGNNDWFYLNLNDQFEATPSSGWYDLEMNLVKSITEDDQTFIEPYHFEYPKFYVSRPFDTIGIDLVSGKQLQKIVSPKIPGKKEAIYISGYKGGTFDQLHFKDGKVIRTEKDYRNDNIISIDFHNPLKAETRSKTVHWVHYENGGSIMYSEDGYYFGDQSVRGKILFEVNGLIYPAEQFDLKYNRPDLIMDRLGYADSSLINNYRKAYLKRLDKMGFDESMLRSDFHLPELKIINNNSTESLINAQQTNLSLSASDSKYPLDRINVWINNVPIFGTEGIDVRELSVFSIDTSLLLQLSSGYNKIEVSVLNQAGAESFRETIIVDNKSARPKSNLHFIGIGVKDYQDSSMNLAYSDKDIRDMAEMLSKAKGYGTVHIDTFLNENVTTAILPKIRQRLEETSIHDQVIFMYSGHGLLDQDLNYYLSTHDVDFLYPQKQGLLYEDVNDLFDGIPARKKLILLDACHSGELDKDEVELTASTGNLKEKDFSKASLNSVIASTGNSFELMKELFADLRRGTGATVISSSSGKYYSYEDATHQNGIYTYALKEGLEGAADANNDQEISVSELKTYLYHRVSELTNGKQKPTTREENLEFDFRVY